MKFEVTNEERERNQLSRLLQIEIMISHDIMEKSHGLDHHFML